MLAYLKTTQGYLTSFSKNLIYSFCFDVCTSRNNDKTPLCFLHQIKLLWRALRPHETISMVLFQAKFIVLFRDGRPKKKICQEWWFGHGRGGQVLLRLLSFCIFHGKKCSIFQHPQPHLHQPRKKTSKKLYFSIQEKSSKMDLFGLAASHLGGLALCAL